MIYATVPQRRPWVGIGWLAALAVGLLLSILNLYLGIALIGLATAAVLLLALPATRSRAAAPATWRASARRTIATADQEERVGFVVPAESTPGYTPMLTRDGYVLVNEAGTIVYRLK